MSDPNKQKDFIFYVRFFIFVLCVGLMVASFVYDYEGDHQTAQLMGMIGALIAGRFGYQYPNFTFNNLTGDDNIGKGNNSNTTAGGTDDANGDTKTDGNGETKGNGSNTSQTGGSASK